jgi:transcriptional regulator with XRE-family HTH domain
MNDVFSKRLKELRKERGLTQETLSEISGVSLPTVCRYEKGSRDEPKLSILKKFSNFFGVSLDYIVGDTDVKDTNFTSVEIARIFTLLNDDSKKVLMDLAKNLLKMEGKE